MLTSLTQGKLAEREGISPQAVRYRIDNKWYIPIREYRKRAKKGYVIKHGHLDDLADFFKKNEKTWSKIKSMVEGGGEPMDAS